MIELGQKVRDTLSGLEGTVVARTEWMYGCVRVTIQPFGVKDGKPHEMCVVDEPQLKAINQKRAKEVAPRHGSRPDSGHKVDLR